MAQRRMFSLKVIDTDLFLDMPLSTQCLYFHLSIRADDDGFIGNHKKIMRMIGSSDDDMRILIAKQLIIPFDTGVCVIKHWRVHNYIQKDRYNPTFYKAEKAQIVANNNVYEKIDYIDTKCIHDVSNKDTQVRLGKDRIELGKDNIDIYTENESLDNYVNESNKLKEFRILYEKNIGLINGITAEYLIELSETIEVDLFKRAIEIATDKGKCSLGYIKGIIKQWLDVNIKTLEQLEAYKLQQKSKQKDVKTNGSSTRRTKQFEQQIPADDEKDEEYYRLLEECERLSRE